MNIKDIIDHEFLDINKECIYIKFTHNNYEVVFNLLKDVDIKHINNYHLTQVDVKRGFFNKFKIYRKYDYIYESSALSDLLYINADDIMRSIKLTQIKANLT
jgi:hypothetical protein